MKIGDEIYVHGYVDEIRDDTVIVRNGGGYFGTAASEIKASPAAKCVAQIKVNTDELIKRIKEEYDLADAEWEDDDVKGYVSGAKHKCSRCGKSALTHQLRDMTGFTWEKEYLTEFCPFCGADMRGGTDGTE